MDDNTMSKPLSSRAIDATTVSSNEEVLIPKSESIEREPRESRDSVDALRGFLQGPNSFQREDDRL